MIHSREHYLNLFAVSEELPRKIIAEALRSGGSWADLYFENTTYTSLMLRDGEVTSGGSHLDFGVGIRVLSGEKTGYAYTESTLEKDLKEAARTAGAIAVSAVSSDIPTPCAFRGEPNPAADRYPVQKHWRTTPATELKEVLEKLEKAIRIREPRVVKVIGSLACQVTDVLMYNSLGELKYDTRPMGSLSATVIFSDGGKVENKTASRSFRTGAEMLSDSLVEELAEEAVRNLDARFAAIRPKGGKMSVVMDAGASGILLHEAIGHAFEADFIRKGQSIFTGRMGELICDSAINVIDDGTIKGNRGSLNYDDEGVPGQRTMMVTEGRLTSFLHDRISAAHFGVRPTGNGRRESFRYPPIPRMRATYMESGPARAEDIIAEVSAGVYVDEFSNGQVKIGEGDFTFYVKSGYLIENGRLTAPIKDINIIGNGPQALAGIRAVGNDARIDNGTWICGKEQSVPVSCGIPTVLVDSLTVGGE